MKLLPVSSVHQLANIFTKALSPKPFTSILSKLGLVDIFQPPACGGVSDEPNISSLVHQQEENKLSLKQKPNKDG